MAMLLQETAKSASQCEGYLCGEINVEQTSNITDSEVRDETEEIMCKKFFFFILTHMF